jgi:hypothetical protein
MAKRVRYPARSARRAGASRPSKPSSSGSGTRPAAAKPNTLSIPVPAPNELAGDDMPIRSSSHLTEVELQRAAELEAEATARDRAAIADSLRRRASAATESARLREVNAPLSVRMSHEYAYVARDVRRIILTASLMVGILAVLYVLVNVMGVITL